MYLNDFQQNLHLGGIFYYSSLYCVTQSKIIQILPFQTFLIQRLEPGRAAAIQGLER